MDINKQIKFLMKKAKVLTLRDNFPNIEDYDFIDIGLQNVEVSKIVGICDSRTDEYNSDFSPIDKNDERWQRIYNGYKNDESVPPIPLILAPDGNFYGDGDGSHRISAAKALNLRVVPAKVMKMVEVNKNINRSWQEYAKDRISKLNKMSKEYQTMWPQFYKLQDEAFESGDYGKYEKFQEEMNSLGDKISLLDKELMQEEKEYKQQLLKENSQYKRLKKADDGMGGDISWETINAPAEPIQPNIVNNDPAPPQPDRMLYPMNYPIKDKRRKPKKRLFKKANFDKNMAQKIEDVLEGLTRQLGKNGNDPVSNSGNTIEKSYRNFDFFTSNDEDDDWPDFTGESKAKKIVEDKLLALKLLDKVKVELNDDEKSWFTVYVTLK